MRKILTFLLLGAVLNNGCKCKKDDPVEPLPEIVEEVLIPKIFHDGSVSRSITCSDGNILAYGRNSTDSALLMKISITTGSLMWSKHIPSTDMADISGITETPGGDIILSGVEKETNQGKTVVVAYNSNGEKKWRKLYGDDAIQVSTKILCMRNGKLMLVSTHSGGSSQYVLTRYVLETNGDEVSHKDLGFNEYRVYLSLIQKKDNSLALLGTIINMPGNYELHLIKMDETGELLSQNEIAKPGVNLSGYSIKEINDGELLCCGSHKATGELYKGFVMRLNNSHNETSYELHSASDTDVILTELVTGGEGYTAVGNKREPVAGAWNGFLVTCKPTNEVVRKKTYAVATGRGEVLENVWLKNNTFVVLGNSFSTTTSVDNKFFVMGLDKDGNPK